MVEATQSSRFWPNLYDPLRGLGTRLSDWLSPASDASSDDTSYRITLELPGVDEKDIDLSIAEGMLTVSGEKSESREEEGETWYFSERSYGAFRRAFRLPPDADGDKVEAHTKNGVLEIIVPRRKEEAIQSRKIEVKKA